MIHFATMCHSHFVLLFRTFCRINFMLIKMGSETVVFFGVLSKSYSDIGCDESDIIAVQFLMFWKKAVLVSCS